MGFDDQKAVCVTGSRAGGKLCEFNGGTTMASYDISDDQADIGVNGEKVGYKNPPKKGQFGQTNQPDRAKRAASKAAAQAKARPVDPMNLLTEAVYEKVDIVRDGKKESIPYIEAFFRQMKRNAITGKIGEQIKFLKELIKIGVFDLEEYKQRLFKVMRARYDRYFKNANILADRYCEMARNFQLISKALEMYMLTAILARRECKCGAAERNFSDLDKIKLMDALILPEPSHPDYELYGFNEYRTSKESSESTSSGARKKAQSKADAAKKADDEFRAGMIGDD